MKWSPGRLLLLALAHYLLIEPCLTARKDKSIKPNADDSADPDATALAADAPDSGEADSDAAYLGAADSSDPDADTPGFDAPKSDAADSGDSDSDVSGFDASKSDAADSGDADSNTPGFGAPKPDSTDFDATDFDDSDSGAPGLGAPMSSAAESDTADSGTSELRNSDVSPSGTGDTDADTADSGTSELGDSDVSPSGIDDTDADAADSDKPYSRVLDSGDLDSDAADSDTTDSDSTGYYAPSFGAPDFDADSGPIDFGAPDSDAAASKTADVDAADSDTNNSDATASKTPDVDATDSDATASKTANVDAPYSDATVSKTPDVDAVDSDVTDSDANVSKTPDVDAVDSDVTDSDANVSKTPDVDAADSDAADSDATDSDANESYATASKTPDVDAADSDTAKSSPPGFVAPTPSSDNLGYGASYSDVFDADSNLTWWQTKAIYQIYPRSFKDSDGDGIGDIKGILEKVDYLEQLGIGAVWLSPIFKSPMADFGYDISDYRDIDPIFGTMDDFDNLQKALQSRGIKVLLDLVPNHSSDEHEWFQNSVQRIDPYTDYYVWADAKNNETGDREPPCNWISVFGGSAWTWNEERGQYYLHQFLDKQPDLNYRNPAVLQEMQDVMRFWLDKGVDGFRTDACAELVEDDQLLDEPLSYKEGVGPEQSDYLNHVYTKYQDGSFDVVYAFKSVINEYDSRFIMVESYAPPSLAARWYGNETVDGADFPFNPLFLTSVNYESNAQDFETVIQTWYDAMPEHNWANWVIGNHDNPRPAARFGELLDSMHILQAIMPGTMITYGGDEIAMVGGRVRWSEVQDPQGLNAGTVSASRDPERTPYQWNNSLSAGFSSNATTWLPVDPNFWYLNLESQMTGKSHLTVYASLIALKSLPVIQTGSMKVAAVTEDILVIVRALGADVYVAVINTGSFESTFDLENCPLSLVPPGETWRVYASSVNCEISEGETVDTSNIQLRPKAGVVFMRKNSGEDASSAPSLGNPFATNAASSDEKPWYAPSNDYPTDLQWSKVSTGDEEQADQPADENQAPQNDSAAVEVDESPNDGSNATEVELPSGAWVVAPGDLPNGSSDVENDDANATQSDGLPKNEPDEIPSDTPDDDHPSGASGVTHNVWSLLVCFVSLLLFSLQY